MPEVVEIRGLERLEGKLTTLAQGQYLRGILTAAVLDIKGYMGWYPPASEANSPSNRRWYERGFGPRWRRKDGSVGGYQTSERLDARWAAASPQISQGGLTARVGVNVSYAPYVQSYEKQAGFHRARGWRTDRMAVQERGPHIQKLVSDAVRRILEAEQATSPVELLRSALVGIRQR